MELARVFDRRGRRRPAAGETRGGGPGGRRRRPRCLRPPRLRRGRSGRRAPLGVRFRPAPPARTGQRGAAGRGRGGAGAARPGRSPRRPPGAAVTPALTAVRAAAAASPPLPLRGSRRRGRGAAAAPTRVVDVQLVRDALVAPAEDDHQLPDGHGPVSVPGAGHRPGEGGNPPPVQEAGSRHLPNPRPSAHNSARPLRRLGSRPGGDPPPAVRSGRGAGRHVTAGARGGAASLRRGRGGRRGRGTWGARVRGAGTSLSDRVFPPPRPIPARTAPGFVFARQGRAFSFTTARSFCDVRASQTL